MEDLGPEHEVARLPLEVAGGLHVEYSVEQGAGGGHAVDFGAAAACAQTLQQVASDNLKRMNGWHGEWGIGTERDEAVGGDGGKEKVVGGGTTVGERRRWWLCVCRAWVAG